MITPRLSVRPIASCALLLLATACAETNSGRYPSLLPRAIETRGDAEPVAAAPVVEPDPTLDAQVAGSLAALAGNEKDFATAATRADAMARAAKGDKAGGERWIEAQTALAELDTYRATGLGIVTDLEEAALARAADGKPPYPALDAAQVTAQAALEAETTKIQALQASLPEA